MSIYKNGKLIAGGRQCMPLLSFMWADHILNDASWLRADTFSWQSGSVYQAVYAHLTADITGKTLQSETISGTTIQFYLADDGHKICPDSQESNVASIYSATGVAWYYIIDTTNQRFKLPRTKFGFTGIRSGVGNYVAPGAPDIDIVSKTSQTIQSSTAPAGTPLTGVNGSFGIQTSGTAYGNSNPAGMMVNSSLPAGTHFGASNEIYGNSTTIQPPATQMYLYFYVGNFTQTALENTAGLNAELFNGKADVSTVAHVVIEFQAPTAGNNYTWYRKYADGWVEQGGHYSHDNVEKTVTTTLAVAMTDAHYNLQITKELGTNAEADTNYQFISSYVKNSKTTTSFQTRMTANNRLNGYDWQVSGMAAS